jgi:hypothetical protein
MNLAFLGLRPQSLLVLLGILLFLANATAEPFDFSGAKTRRAEPTEESNGVRLGFHIAWQSVTPAQVRLFGRGPEIGRHVDLLASIAPFQISGMIFIAFILDGSLRDPSCPRTSPRPSLETLRLLARLSTRLTLCSKRNKSRKSRLGLPYRMER